jgi:hypothetical protein
MVSTLDTVPIAALWVEGLLLLQQLTDSELWDVLERADCRLHLAKRQIIAEHNSQQQQARA